MKKLLYFFLLFFFVGCSEAPKEQQIVMEYLTYSDSIRRYKPLEWGKLDTIYSSAVDDDPLYIGYITEIMLFIVKPIQQKIGPNMKKNISFRPIIPYL